MTKTTTKAKVSKTLPTPISDAEIAALKASAVFAEKGKTHFTVRFLIVGGRATSEQLRAAAALAKRFGTGEVHLTTRQGLEIPHIPYPKLAKFREVAAALPLKPAPSGPCVRAVTACPGTYCRFGTIDTQGLAAAIFKRFGKRKNLPHKFKIAVGGCRHNCAKPQANDIGIVGAPGGGFTVLVGGMAGKTPRWGDPLPETIADKKTLFAVIGKILDWYNAHGNPKERFGAAIDRLGLTALREYLGNI